MSKTVPTQELKRDNESIKAVLSVIDHKVPENRVLLTDFDRFGQNSDPNAVAPQKSRRAIPIPVASTLPKTESPAQRAEREKRLALTLARLSKLNTPKPTS